MKRTTRICAFLLALILSLSSAPIDAIQQISKSPFVVQVDAASTTHLNTTKKTLYLKEKLTLKLIDKKGKTISAKKVKWATSNKKLATVNSKGVVTAVKAGKVKITAKYGGKTYTATITVKDTTAINKTAASISVGDKTTLKITYKGKSVSSKSVKWTTSNKKVATVSSTGVVAAKKAGKATITATYKGTKVTCKVTVTPKIGISNTTLDLLTQEEFPLAIYEGAVWVKTGVKWTTSNKKVATVNSKGVVTAKKAGTATITATYKGKTMKATVTVKTAIFANKNTLTFDGADASKQTVTVTFRPSGSVYYEIVEGTDVISCSWIRKWNGDKTKLDVTPKASGKARIKLYAENNPKQCCYIDVTVKSDYNLTVKNSLPCIVSNYESGDYYNKGEEMSSVKITDVDYEFTSYGTLTVTVKFEAYASYYTEGYYYFKYRILDEDGYVVEFDRQMCERMYVGDKGKEEIIVFDLEKGNYTIEFLDHYANA